VTADGKTVQAVYETLRDEHARNLERFGVELPPLLKRNGEYNLRALQLVFLRQHLGCLVHRDELTGFVRSFVEEASGDQQPRHLKYSGWDVRLAGKARDYWLDGKYVPNGYNGLAQVQTPSPTFLKDILKRAGKLQANDWDSLCAAYDHRCATCGEKVELLERGHKDPSLPDSHENVLPMCGACNNWASNDLVFNDKGRVVALATPRLVRESDKRVQFEIYKWLKTQFK